MDASRRLGVRHDAAGGGDQRPWYNALRLLAGWVRAEQGEEACSHWPSTRSSSDVFNAILVCRRWISV